MLSVALCEKNSADRRIPPECDGLLRQKQYELRALRLCVNINKNHYDNGIKQKAYDCKNYPARRLRV